MIYGSNNTQKKRSLARVLIIIMTLQILIGWCKIQKIEYIRDGA